MFAQDLLGPWFVDAQLAYNCTLELAGAAPIKLHARQRPTLLKPPHGCPILYTGASTDPSSQYDSSFTMAQEVACVADAATDAVAEEGIGLSRW